MASSAVIGIGHEGRDFGCEGERHVQARVAGQASTTASPKKRAGASSFRAEPAAVVMMKVFDQPSGPCPGARGSRPNRRGSEAGVCRTTSVSGRVGAYVELEDARPHSAVTFRIRHALPLQRSRRHASVMRRFAAGPCPGEANHAEAWPDRARMRRCRIIATGIAISQTLGDVIVRNRTIFGKASHAALTSERRLSQRSSCIAGAFWCTGCARGLRDWYQPPFTFAALVCSRLGIDDAGDG